jgi:simple sugar transport system permease protein
MAESSLLNTLNSVVANATPLVIASIGETITERAGVINLSLNGSILFAAMLGFVAAKSAEAVIVGIAVAAVVGAMIALIVALAAIELRQDQVAIGFVLTLLAADLAKFHGQPYNGQRGPTMPNRPIPFLENIPVAGKVFFDHDFFVYFSFVLVFLTWFWLFRTRPGLEHRAIGEHPEAAFARGARVTLMRYVYTIIGGALVGVAGAAYSLSLKAGWLANPPMDGDGWIALAIVIFGGWHPFRVALGAYLFAGLRALSSTIQRSDIEIPLVLLNTLPWVLMVATLMLVSGGGVDRLLRLFPRRLQHRLRYILRSDPPKAIGTVFDSD